MDTNVLTSSAHPLVAPECREFVVIIEEMLVRRRARERSEGLRVARQDDRFRSAWTRDELCDLAYSSYKAMLRGVVRRPPRRRVVVAIAGYLEATSSERNQLLVAAGYGPDQPGLEGAALSRALDWAAEVVDHLPMPACVITRDWHIHLVNDYLFTMYGVSRADWEAIPTLQRNVFWLVFDPALGLRALYSPTEATWKNFARGQILLFRQENIYCQYDDWYRDLVRQLMPLPDFADCWESSESDAAALDEVGDATTMMAPILEIRGAGGGVFRVVPMYLQAVGRAYPKIVVYLPADAATQRIFSGLGLPTPAHGWAVSTRP